MRIDKKCILLRIVTGVFLLFACFFMYDFYKCLSGFIANGFREPLVMLPMILAFLLPVICFLFFFYDRFVRCIGKAARVIYSVFVICYSVADLCFILSNIDLYVSNNRYGVYDSLPSIIMHFPYDMIVLLTVLAALAVFNLVTLIKPGRAGDFLGDFEDRGLVCVGALEYIALSVMAILVFVFSGSAVYATFSAIENAIYDARYVYLLLWVMLIPMANLAALVLKPEKMNISKRARAAFLSSLIGANLIFGLLFLAFELATPSFLVGIGKPLFLIAFSVSLPIEPLAIFLIMAIGTVIALVRLVKMIKDKNAGALDFLNDLW